MKDNKDVSDDAPPNSRLFIICAKDLTEENFKDAFEAHGTIEKIDIHKDKNGNSKGLAYIKFSKTSEAAHALEQLNGRCIGNHPRPLKVLVASNRKNDQNYKSKQNGQNLSSSSKDDEERLLRLFVVVPKDKLEEDIKDYFSTFGDVQYVNIVKDKETKKSRGFAYVKFYRLIHAAAAFESCDRSYKPVFAEPRPPKPEVMPAPNPSFSSQHRPLTQTASNESGTCVLHVVCSLRMTEDQLWRLFDLVPGLDFCEIKFRDVRNNRAVGSAVFTNSRSAMYARDKLHGFEYPPGERLIVKLDHGEAWQSSSAPAAPVYNGSNQTSYNDGVMQASQMLRTVHISPPLPPPPPPSQPTTHAYIYDPAYCSIALPPPQPLSHPESPLEDRLFIVCSPSTPPVYIAKDVFCRFGGLIDLYFLNGKRCGYALFSHLDSAKKALMTMNGQEICGVRLKVMPAEPRRINENNAIQDQPE